MTECSLDQCSCGKCRLLLGEGYTSVYDAVEKNLRKCDFNIAATADSKHEIIREYVNWKPHVVLLDLDLPGSTALDTLKQLRKVNPNIQVLILTDKPSRDSVILAKKLGARDYILTNASADRFRETIRSVCPIRQARMALDDCVDDCIDEFVEELDREMFKDLPKSAPSK
ncbi:MAG: response regulator [bacterium]